MSLTDVIELILHTTFADWEISSIAALGNAAPQGQRYDKEVADLHRRIVCRLQVFFLYFMYVNLYTLLT
jgi:hypothetical protein